MSQSVIPPLPARSWLTAVAAVIAGLLGGALSAGLIALINEVLNGSDRSQTWLALGFIGLVVGRVLANAASRLLLNSFTQRMIAELCRNMSRRVLATPLSQLERVGIPRILATLTDDVAWIGWALQHVPGTAMNAAILMGAAIYLGWLSLRMLIVASCVMAIGVFGYRVLIGRAYRFLQRARDTRDLLFHHFRSLTEGMKELKIHAGRREAFFAERIVPATEALRRDTLSGIRHHEVADTFTQLVFYGLIGGMLLSAAVIPNVSAKARTGYVLAMLYLMAPMWSLMDAWSILARGRIALEKVRALGLSLESQAEHREISSQPPPPWQRLSLESVTFAYPSDNDEQGFVLGPVDFELRAGELVFVVGGNGSGKSTLIKILTGLYTSQTGAMLLDGHVITDENRESYTGYFSAVFSDFFLFDSLLGLPHADVDTRARRYLVDLELDKKVQIFGGAFSTIALSQGQRKRLALLTAFLEDRSIYVFDEWAADQDPHYREIFYKRLLPELKTRGKTIVVITHDDRYYHLGDRVVKLEYGRIVSETKPATGYIDSNPDARPDQRRAVVDG